MLTVVLSGPAATSCAGDITGFTNFLTTDRTAFPLHGPPHCWQCRSVVAAIAQWCTIYMHVSKSKREVGGDGGGGGGGEGREREREREVF